MYNMSEFYEFHGINRRHFAKMVGVAYATLMRYESGERVSNETKLRIEIGVQIMEDCALRYHPSGERVMKSENEYMDKIFDNNFRGVILVEL